MVLRGRHCAETSLLSISLKPYQDTISETPETPIQKPEDEQILTSSFYVGNTTVIPKPKILKQNKTKELQTKISD